MVGAWKLLLLNVGGTVSDPTMGWSAEEVVVLLDTAVLEGGGIMEATHTSGEMEPSHIEEGSPGGRGERDRVLQQLLSRTQRARKVKKFVGISLKPLFCRSTPLPAL